MVRPAGHQAEDTAPAGNDAQRAALVFLLFRGGLLGGTTDRISSAGW